MDTGPKVQGRHLDLYVWSCHEALAFGRRRIEVTVLRLGWDPRASSPSLIDRLFRRREVARRAAASRDGEGRAARTAGARCRLPSRTAATASAPKPPAARAPSTPGRTEPATAEADVLSRRLLRLRPPPR